MKIALKPFKDRIHHEIELFGDKSISHRAIILSSIANGKSIIKNLLRAEDCLATIGIMRQLGVQIEEVGEDVIVNGCGLYGLNEPHTILEANNSGTSMRLIAGLLVGQPFLSVICGDYSLQNRPMQRIIKPLQHAGAKIYGRDNNSKAPLCILPSKKIHTVNHQPEIASAQVKSCLMLAALYADGKTTIKEKLSSRDHTERMLDLFGVNVNRDIDIITITGRSELYGTELSIPNDFSTAAYFIALALLIPDSYVVLKNVGINKTRIGLLMALEMMGAKIIIKNEHVVSNEDRGDLEVRYSKLLCAKVCKEMVPLMIDEIPLLAVIAAHAEGITVIEGIEELKYKESNRLMAIISELKKLGIEIWTDDNNLYIKGKTGASINTEVSFNHYNDHRMAMCIAVLCLSYNQATAIDNAEIVSVSCPGFWEKLQSIFSNNSVEVVE